MCIAAVTQTRHLQPLCKYAKSQKGVCVHQATDMYWTALAYFSSIQFISDALYTPLQTSHESQKFSVNTRISAPLLLWKKYDLTHFSLTLMSPVLSFCT